MVGCAIFVVVLAVAGQKQLNGRPACGWLYLLWVSVVALQIPARCVMGCLGLARIP